MATHFSILAWKIPWTEKPATAKSLQSCPTLCDPIDDSPPGSPVRGILQARTLKWVAKDPSPEDLSNPVTKPASPAMRQILYHWSHQGSDLMDCNPPGSSVHGILQARILEWVAIPFSRGSS